MKTPPTWEEEFDKRYVVDNLYIAADGGETDGYEYVAAKSVKDFIRTLLTSHEAAIRQEIGEKLEEIRFDTHNGKDVYQKIVSLLAMINPTP